MLGEAKAALAAVYAEGKPILARFFDLSGAAWARLVVGDAGDAVSSDNPLPVSAPLPARVARTVHRASAALPDSGAYTTHTAYAIPDGVQHVTFFVTYTRGASGGYARFKAIVGNGTETAPTVTIDPTISVSQPTGAQLAYQSIVEGPHPQDGTAITFVITFAVRGGETTIALQAVEAGQTGTPGTCAITLTAGY